MDDLLDGCGITDAVSWRPPEGMTYDQWEEVGRKFQYISGSLNWWLGDWLNEGEKRWGEMYAQAIEVTGSKYETLRTYKWVASAVKLSTRIDNLTWTHHRHVAHLDEAAQRALLKFAAEHQFSSRELLQAVHDYEINLKGVSIAEGEHKGNGARQGALSQSSAPPSPSSLSTQVLRTEAATEDRSWMPDVSAGRAKADLKTFFRYPGGKGKIAGALVDEILSLSRNGDEYREPFIGGGGVFLPVLASGKFKRLWINDFDYGIYCIWLSVRSFHTELVDHVCKFAPTVDAFYQFRDLLSTDCRHLHPAEVALMKIAIHQTSYSGLGTRAGGPIGGLEQKSAYDVGCRWNTDNIVTRICDIHDAMNQADVVITNMDYRSLLTGSNAVIYLDPPYYEKGSSLYQVTFTEQDHEDLAERLRTAKFPWLLSYDKCDNVKGLYSWANLRETEEVHYSIALKQGDAGKQSRYAAEYLIDGRLS